MDQLFDFCVELLSCLADLLGLTYEAVNVWIFCIIWPFLSISAIVYICHLRKQIRNRAKRR